MIENTIIQDLIQSQLFHLISMLLCIGVVVWLFVRHYGSQSESSDAEKKLHLVNTLYISGILVFILIELVTAICMGNTHHADILSFVSFASTISSLILSVIAIIFTIVSSKRGEDQYRKIDSASDEVTKALRQFSNKTSDIDESVGRFSAISEDLTDNMNAILAQLKELQNKTDILVNSQTAGQANVEGAIRQKGVDGKELVQRFISVGSFSGNLALYACILANEKKVSFPIRSITNTDDDATYKFGYLIAAGALGIIEGQVSPSECSITSYFPGMKEMVVEACHSFMDKAERREFKNADQNAWDMVVNYFKDK